MSRQNRENIFLNVETKEPELPKEEEILDMKPIEEIEKPTEKDIFKQPELKLEKPIVKRKADRITDAKRTVTPKMRAHLDKIRGKASEAKKKKACEKNGVEYIPPAPQEDIMPPQAVPKPIIQAPRLPTITETVTPVRHPQPELDYDRIVNGLWSKQQRYNEDQKYKADIREQIRKEEREKALKESTTLFESAAVKYKKAHQAQMGSSVLLNYQNKYQGHPVFRQKTNLTTTPSGGAENPFDVCFK